MKRIWPLLLIAVVSASALQAEEPAYSLSDCIKLTLEKSAAARNATIDEAIAGARVKQARSIAMPHLSVAALYTRLDELQEIEFGDEVQDVGTLDNYSLEGKVEQLLFGGGKMKAALMAAGITREHAQYIRAEVESAVTRDTTALYNNILLAEETVLVMEESVKLLKALVTQTEQIRAAGKAAEFEVLTAQVRHANELPQLIRAKNSLAVLRQNLEKLTGIDSDGMVLAGLLNYEEVALSSDRLIATALELRPLLRSQQAMADLRKEDVTSARSDMIPSISGYFSYNGANSYRFVSFGDNEWEWHWNAGVALNWNLWDGGLSSGALKEKKLERAKSIVNLDDSERAVVLEVKSAILTIGHASESVVAASRNVKLAEKAMEIAATRHEEGLATYLEYTDANVELKRAKLSHLTSVVAHMNALADLKHAVGFDFEKKFEKKTNGDSDE